MMLYNIGKPDKLFERLDELTGSVQMVMPDGKAFDWQSQGGMVKSMWTAVPKAPVDRVGCSGWTAGRTRAPCWISSSGEISPKPPASANGSAGAVKQPAPAKQNCGPKKTGRKNFWPMEFERGAAIVDFSMKHFENYILNRSKVFYDQDRRTYLGHSHRLLCLRTSGRGGDMADNDVFCALKTCQDIPGR